MAADSPTAHLARGLLDPERPSAATDSGQHAPRAGMEGHRPRQAAGHPRRATAKSGSSSVQQGISRGAYRTHWSSSPVSRVGDLAVFACERDRCPGMLPGWGKDSRPGGSARESAWGSASGLCGQITGHGGLRMGPGKPLRSGPAADDRRRWRRSAGRPLYLLTPAPGAPRRLPGRLPGRRMPSVSPRTGADCGTR